MPVPGIDVVFRIVPFAVFVMRNPFPPTLYPTPDLLKFTRSGPKFTLLRNLNPIVLSSLFTHVSKLDTFIFLSYCNYKTNVL